MTNTKPVRLSPNVFQRQFYSANGQQPQGGVGQDNPTPPRARTASPQPAPRKNMLRPQAMNSNPHRSQNRPTPKRKTVHLTLWVKPVVKAELERRAASEGLSISATGAAFLEHALQQDIHTQHGALLDTIIDKAIRKHMRSYSTRIAMLLVRVAFDAGQTRSLVTNLLGRHPGVTPKELTEILDGSSKAAKSKITRSTPQLAELIAEVEQWFREGNLDE